MKNMLLSAAMLAVGASGSGPALAFNLSIFDPIPCYQEKGAPEKGVFRFNVKHHSALASAVERLLGVPEQRTYTALGKAIFNEPTNGQTPSAAVPQLLVPAQANNESLRILPIQGEILVGKDKGTVWYLNSPPFTSLVCVSSDDTPTPDELICGGAIVAPETNTNPSNAKFASSQSTLEKVDPSQNHFCSGFPEIQITPPPATAE